MDAILFYGEGSRSDASRRQVRSAAAQHSHRIGPRKPKSSKKPKSQFESSHQKTRSLKANILDLSPSSSPSGLIAGAVGQAGKLAVAPAHAFNYAPPAYQATSTRPPFSAHSIPRHSVNAHDDHAAAVPSTIDRPLPGGLNDTTSREKELKRQAAQARLHEIHAFQQQHEVRAEREIQQTRSYEQQAPLLPYQVQKLPSIVTSTKLPTLHIPAPSPLVIERIDTSEQDSTLSSESRQNTQASPKSPPARLPQYSWTEYPRYGLGVYPSQSSLQMLAQVATAERDSSEAQSRSARSTHDVPGFRPFDSATRPSEQSDPPRSSPPQSGRLHELPPAVDQSHASGLPEAGPQLAPLAIQPHSDRSSIPESSSFGQFLHSAINGHERIDEAHQRTASMTSESQIHDVKPHFSPG